MPIPLVVTTRYGGQRVTSGDNPLLKPTGIQIATKPLPGPTNREHRKHIGAKMSLGTNYSSVEREYAGKRAAEFVLSFGCVGSYGKQCDVLCQKYTHVRVICTAQYRCTRIGTAKARTRLERRAGACFTINPSFVCSSREITM